MDAPKVRAAALQDLGVELAQIGRTEEAMTTIEEAFTAAKEAGDRVNLQRAYNNFASLLVYNGSDLRRAREISREGLELAERSRGRGWIGWNRNTDAEISISLGDLDAAESSIRESIDHATAAGDRPLVGLSSMILAWTLLWRGDLDGAEGPLAEAERILREMPEPQGEVTFDRVAGELALARGREAEALLRLEAGADQAAEYAVDQDPRVLLELIRLRVRRSERPEAGRALEILRRGAAPFSRACAEVAEGLLLDRPMEAVTALRAAADHTEALGFRIDLGRTLFDLGRAEARAGDDPVASFERAREILVDTGALLFVPEIDEELDAGA